MAVKEIRWESMDTDQGSDSSGFS